MSRTMEEIWFKANIHYFCREKYYNRMYKTAKTASSKYADNVEYPFYRGVALVLEGQVQKGIQELSSVQSNKDIQIGVILALIYAHKRLTSIDREVLQSLDSRLKEDRKHASAVALYYAALFLNLAEKHEKAAEYIAKSLKRDPSNFNTLILKGWNELHLDNNKFETSTECLNLALTKSDKNAEAMLGLAKVQYLKHNHDASNLVLDQIIVSNTDQVTPVKEKMKNDLALKKWEAVSDSLERITTMEPDSIEALKTLIFVTVCRNGDLIDVTEQLNRYYTLLEMDEPLNGYQFFDISQLVSRVCGRSTTILTQTYKFVQHASELYPTNIDYLSEIGYHCLLQGKPKEAHNFFKAASKIDSNSLTALCGLTLSQMMDTGHSEQIEQQVELLNEMQGSTKLPILSLLSAKLAKKDAKKATMFLDEAINSKISEAEKQVYGIKYVKELNPDFLLELYKEYQLYLPKKPSVIIGYVSYNEETSNSCFESCCKILQTIKNACPGLLVASYELARLKFLFGFASEAQKLIQHALEIDNTHSGSYILLAQIFIQKQLYHKAAQNLEICLSYNFKVRDSAMYHFVNGIIQKSNNDNQEALRSLTTCLQLINTKNLGSPQKSNEAELNVTDKATLYLLLIEIRSGLGQFSEAGKLMQDAIQEFSFTTEEGRLVLAKAELALKNGDVDRAIDLLDDVKPGQPYYFQAHTKMAHIYLKEKKDRAMFTNCFRDIVANHPMADSHVLMGDAYMSINEPFLAAEAYESAIRTDSQNMNLIKKLVSAYVKTHHYGKAIKLYEDSISKITDEELKFNYLDLLISLKQYEKAESYSTRVLEQYSRGDTQAMRGRVRALVSQARARELRGAGADTALGLMEARHIQTALLKRLQLDSVGDIPEEKQLLSRILCRLARVKSPREPGVAASLYAEALVNTPRDPPTLLALAKLYAQMNNVERCEQTCSILLDMDPNNEDAAIMMADLAFRKVDFAIAERHLSRVLCVNPKCWRALAQLVEVKWRRGRLPEAEGAIQLARESLRPDENDEGYCLCAGVYAWRAGRGGAALRLLSACRRSPLWGAEAARRMLLLCLFRDNSDPQSRYNILKQPTRAKNILKRTISNIPWTPENADALERCWLEVVEQQLSSGRQDAARELLHTLLQHNKSCAQAYKHLGYLSEKEQNYKQAASHYESAWALGERGDAGVGARLAACHLRLRNYPETIVVCRRVLADQPDHPKLRKDVYEKAKNCLRT